ncbi:MAG: SGNH/GDSL hydrolase family protein, partial [Lachnospiraceae bacterium]
GNKEEITPTKAVEEGKMEEENKETVKEPEETTPTPFVPENPDRMPTEDEEIELSLAERLSVFGQEIGADNGDGSVTFSGGTVNKCMFPLPSTVKSGATISVTVKAKFASEADSPVRMYLTNQGMENCSASIYYLSNNGQDTTTASFALEASAEASGIMLASSSFDTYFQDFTIVNITVGGDLEVSDSGTESPDYAEAAASDWYQTLLSKAQLNLGNNKRLKAVIERAQAGEQITIASIGGSITEGAGAVKYKECYAYQTYESFKNAYGAGDGSNVCFVNAGVGGTPSTFGLLRYNRDIVSRVTDEDGLPDIVLVEYAVNDGGEPTMHGCYESLVKQILQQPNEPVVILVFAVFPSGYTLQNELVKVGTAYDLMMVSIKDGAFPFVGDKWTSSEFFYDIYHPTTLGHKVMADCIFHTIKAAAEQPEAASDINLEVPAAYGTDYIGLKTIFKDSYEEDIKLSVGSFGADDANAYQNIPIGKVYAKNFYHTAGSGNESLTFEVTCKNFLISYRAVNDASYGKIDVYVDGKKVRTINGNTGSWGQSVTDLIFADAAAAEHKIEIKMAAGDENKKFTITCMGYTE